jgi:hypothetical protein
MAVGTKTAQTLAESAFVSRRPPRWRRLVSNRNLMIGLLILLAIASLGIFRRC